MKKLVTWLPHYLVPTIKFEYQDELDKLIDRICLDTNRKFSKKELFELIFKIGTRDYHLLLEAAKQPKTIDDEDLRKKFIERFSGAISISNGEVDQGSPKAIWEIDVD